MKARFSKGDRVEPSFEWLRSGYYARRAGRKGTVRTARADLYGDDEEPWFYYTVQWDDLLRPTAYVNEHQLMLVGNLREEARIHLQRAPITGILK